MFLDKTSSPTSRGASLEIVETAALRQLVLPSVVSLFQKLFVTEVAESDHIFVNSNGPKQSIWVVGGGIIGVSPYPVWAAPPESAEVIWLYADASIVSVEDLVPTVGSPMSLDANSRYGCPSIVRALEASISMHSPELDVTKSECLSIAIYVHRLEQGTWPWQQSTSGSWTTLRSICCCNSILCAVVPCHSLPSPLGTLSRVSQPPFPRELEKSMNLHTFVYVPQVLVIFLFQHHISW